jgi:hypothetical protein
MHFGREKYYHTTGAAELPNDFSWFRVRNGAGLCALIGNGGIGWTGINDEKQDSEPHSLDNQGTWSAKKTNRSAPDHFPASLWTTMSAFSLVKFGLCLAGRCRHIAKRADGIYRFIWINAVEELVKVHIPTCILGPHDWIPKCRGCTAREKTEVASPQSALQQLITPHPVLLNTASLAIRRICRAARGISPASKNDNPPKKPALSCAKPALDARRRRWAPSFFLKRCGLGSTTYPPRSKSKSRVYDPPLGRRAEIRTPLSGPAGHQKLLHPPCLDL